MTRTIFAIATALLSVAALGAPAAQACISCEYTPEVVGASSTSHGSKSYAKQRALMASKAAAAQAAKKRLATPSAQPSLKPAKVAKAPEVSKPAEVAAAKTETTTETQPETASTTVATGSSIEADTAPVEETKVAADVGCKKFIPAVGLAITVPCE